jgi:hypothetical protein
MQAPSGRAAALERRQHQLPLMVGSTLHHSAASECLWQTDHMLWLHAKLGSAVSVHLCQCNACLLVADVHVQSAGVSSASADAGRTYACAEGGASAAAGSTTAGRAAAAGEGSVFAIERQLKPAHANRADQMVTLLLLLLLH